MLTKVIRFMMLTKVGRFYPLGWLGELIFNLHLEIHGRHKR